jgi:hypothetical protein
VADAPAESHETLEDSRMNRQHPAVVFALPLAAWLLLSQAGSAVAAEFARNANFVVLADDPALAAEVLERAEQYRREIAREWLPEALPDGIGAAMINVRIAPATDEALTWPTDSASSRRFHRVWLTTSREHATGPVLKHELVHVVLATWLPEPLAPWADEGIACRYDDAARIEQRRRTVQWFVRSGNFPRLLHVLEEETITADELASYAIAGSLADFLIERGDRATLLQFAVDGRRRGWDAALQTHYRLNSVDDLQSAWQSWLRGQTGPSSSAGE